MRDVRESGGMRDGWLVYSGEESGFGCEGGYVEVRIIYGDVKACQLEAK